VSTLSILSRCVVCSVITLSILSRCVVCSVITLSILSNCVVSSVNIVNTVEITERKYKQNLLPYMMNVTDCPFFEKKNIQENSVLEVSKNIRISQQIRSLQSMMVGKLNQ
jgi:hypothetical protein